MGLSRLRAGHGWARPALDCRADRPHRYLGQMWPQQAATCCVDPCGKDLGRIAVGQFNLVTNQGRLVGMRDRRRELTLVDAPRSSAGPVASASTTSHVGAVIHLVDAGGERLHDFAGAVGPQHGVAAVGRG